MPRINVTEELLELDRRGLRRFPAVLSGAVGPEVTVDGRQALLFCSNDYLGLADHPALREAAISSFEVFGLGACSSRLVSGTMTVHRELEERLARWIGTERALLFPAGFMANLAVLSTLTGPADVIFSDELNHASIVQGCRLSRARVEVYRHLDLDHLDHLLSRHRTARRRVVVTDALFSVDGDSAPLADLAGLVEEHRASLVADEAHSLGVLGPAGRGLCAEAGVSPEVLVGTFGKAFGCSGAFVASTAEVVSLLESVAVPFMYTTAPLPSLAAALLAALDLVEQADDRRQVVLAHASKLRSALTRAGGQVAPRSFHHIVPVLVPGVTRALALSRELLQRGVFVQALRAPTVRAGTERLRFTPTSRHLAEHIELVEEAFASSLREIDLQQPQRESP